MFFGRKLKVIVSHALCFVMLVSSCNPKQSSQGAGAMGANQGTQAVTQATTPAASNCSAKVDKKVDEAQQGGALSHDNQSAFDLQGEAGSASMATTTLGSAEGGFGLVGADANSSSVGMSYDMITYGINPSIKGNEEFFRVRLCDESGKCQCYAESCGDNNKTCTQYDTCVLPTTQGADFSRFWLKTSDAVNTVPALGLSGAIALQVKYCAYNYFESTDYTGEGNSSTRVEVCGQPLASQNNAYIQQKSSFSLVGGEATAKSQLDALASIKRQKEEECSQLIEQFGAKAATYWIANKTLCSNRSSLPKPEQAACLTLESLAGKIEEYRALLCENDHFYNLGSLLVQSAAEVESSTTETTTTGTTTTGTTTTGTTTTGITTTGSTFGLTGEPKGIFRLVNADPALVEQGLCDTAESLEGAAIGSVDDSIVDSSADAFADFFSDSSTLDSGYDTGSDTTSSSSTDSTVSSTVSSSSSTSSTSEGTSSTYGTSEVDNPAVFDPSLGTDYANDPNFLDPDAEKDTKKAVFFMCAIIFGVLGLHTAFGLIKGARGGDTLDKAEFAKLTADKLDLAEGADKLNRFRGLLGEEAYQSFLGKGTLDDKKYTLANQGKIKKKGLFGERMNITGEFDTESFLTPKAVKGTGDNSGKWFSGLNLDPKLAAEIDPKLPAALEKQGYKVGSDGKYRLDGELDPTDSSQLRDMGGGKYELASPKFTALKTELSNKALTDLNIDLKSKVKMSVDIKTKIDVQSKVITGLKGVGMVGALAGMIFGMSGGFELVGEETPVKNFMDNLFANFFVYQIIPNTSQSYCYAKNMEEITQDISTGLYTNQEFTTCVLKEQDSREDYILSLGQ